MKRLKNTKELLYRINRLFLFFSHFCYNTISFQFYKSVQQRSHKNILIKFFPDKMSTISFYINQIISFHYFSTLHFNFQFQLWRCWFYVNVEKFCNFHVEGKSCCSIISTALSSSVFVVCFAIDFNKSTTNLLTAVVVKKVIKIGFRILYME